jgi:hypothetical protein
VLVWVNPHPIEVLDVRGRSAGPKLASKKTLLSGKGVLSASLDGFVYTLA